VAYHIFGLFAYYTFGILLLGVGAVKASVMLLCKNVS
jgi:hypothetical protein